MREFKIIVEKHPDGYVAYPLGLQGIVVGEGDTYEEAVADVTSAIRFHVETFGKEVLNICVRIQACPAESRAAIFANLYRLGDAEQSLVAWIDIRYGTDREFEKRMSNPKLHR